MGVGQAGCLPQGWHIPVPPALPAEEQPVPAWGGAAAGIGGSGCHFVQSRPGAAPGAPAAAGGYSARQDGWLGARPEAAAWRPAGGQCDGGEVPLAVPFQEGHDRFLNMKEKFN